MTQLVQRGAAQTPADAAGTASADARPSALSDAAVFERALSDPRRRNRSSTSLEFDYDPTLVNTSVSLERLTLGLKQRGQGCICLYGPPGTGKTALRATARERPGAPAAPPLR